MPAVRSVGGVVPPRRRGMEKLLRDSAAFEGIDGIKGGGVEVQMEVQMVSGANMGVGQDWGDAHMAMPVYLPQVAGVGRSGGGAGGREEGGGGGPYSMPPSAHGLQGGLYSSPLLFAPAAAVAVGRDARRAEYVTPQTYPTLEGSGDGARGYGRVDERRGATAVKPLKSERDLSPGRLFLFFLVLLVSPLCWFTLPKKKILCGYIYIYIDICI